MKNLKNLLTILLFSVFTLTITAQEQQQEKITETERIIDKYGEELKEGFNNLVETVTPVAKEGFEIAVKMQIAYGIGEFIKAFVSLLIIILILIIQYRAYSSEINPNRASWEDGIEVSYIGGGVIQIITLVYLTACLYDGILYLYAPEWFAIKEILQLI